MDITASTSAAAVNSNGQQAAAKQIHMDIIASMSVVAVSSYGQQPAAKQIHMDIIASMSVVAVNLYGQQPAAKQIQHIHVALWHTHLRSVYKPLRWQQATMLLCSSNRRHCFVQIDCVFSAE